MAGGGEKSWVNMKLSETLTLALSPREAWFCTSARMSSAPCGDCGLKECCTGSCDWGVSPDNTRGSLVETLSVGPAALVVLSCHRNVMFLKRNQIMLFSSGWLPFLRFCYLLKTIFIFVACWQES